MPPRRGKKRGAPSTTAAAANNNSQDARAEALQKRLQGAGSKSVGGMDTTEAYVVVPDHRKVAIQRAMIHRNQQEFIKGMAEGEAGEDAMEKIGTGPRKLIRKLDNPLRYRGHGVTSGRKTRTQRMIESGQVSAALDRAKQNLLRKSRKSNSATSMNPKDYQEFTSNQRGLLKQARESYGASMKNNSKGAGSDRLGDAYQL